MFGLFKPNIEKMERKKDIEGLIKALGYRKDSVVRVKASNVRKAAEKALSKIKGK
jgi:hypothetical protein